MRKKSSKARKKSKYQKKKMVSKRRNGTEAPTTNGEAFRENLRRWRA